jgi:hypothetical protein
LHHTAHHEGKEEDKVCNALRFIMYTFRGIPRHKHQRSWLRKNAVTLLAGFGGAAVLSMPVWMILLGIV